MAFSIDSKQSTQSDERTDSRPTTRESGDEVFPFLTKNVSSRILIANTPRAFFAIYAVDSA